jgi:metal-dependent amidase/aminoacylase/carboxypeptidase family protein
VIYKWRQFTVFISQPAWKTVDAGARAMVRDLCWRDVSSGASEAPVSKASRLQKIPTESMLEDEVGRVAPR